MGICSRVYQINDDKTCDKHFVTSPQYLITHIQVVLQELVKKNADTKNHKQEIHMFFNENGGLNWQIKLIPETITETV